MRPPAAGPAATVTYMSFTASFGDGWIFGGEMGKKKKRTKAAGKAAAKAKQEKKQPKKRK